MRVNHRWPERTAFHRSTLRLEAAHGATSLCRSPAVGVCRLCGTAWVEERGTISAIRVKRHGRSKKSTARALPIANMVFEGECSAEGVRAIECLFSRQSADDFTTTYPHNPEPSKPAHQLIDFAPPCLSAAVSGGFSIGWHFVTNFVPRHPHATAGERTVAMSGPVRTTLRSSVVEEL